MHSTSWARRKKLTTQSFQVTIQPTCSLRKAGNDLTAIDTRGEGRDRSDFLAARSPSTRRAYNKLSERLRCARSDHGFGGGGPSRGRTVIWGRWLGLFPYTSQARRYSSCTHFDCRAALDQQSRNMLLSSI